MSRRLSVDNRTDGTIDMKELQYLAADGSYGLQIQIPAASRRDDVPASIFKRRNRDSLIPSEIVIFIDGIEFEKSLTPEAFVRNSELIFELDKTNRLLTVSGVPAKPFQLSRLWGFGFLGRKQENGEAQLLFTTRARFRRADWINTSTYI